MNQTKKAMLMMLLTAFLWSLAGVFIKLIEMDALAICPLSRIDGQKNIRYNGKERGQRKWKTNAKKG